MRSFSAAARLTQHRPQVPRCRKQHASAVVPAKSSSVSKDGLSYPTHARGFASSSAKAAESDLNKTELYDLHVEHKAKMVPFAGYSMPLQYGDMSHVESHKWTREKASIFDVSHM